ncbi:MAG: hypothetical protein ACREM8_09465, partial [Vulcanimicrobiaceae bacterium]
MRLGVARGIIVTVVTAAAVLAVGLDLRYLIGGGSFGLRIGYNGYVRSVAAGSPAARAGVAIGDRVGFAAISPKDRARALYADPAVPGARLVARFVRGGKNYDVTLVADRRPIAGATLGLGVAREVALLAAIAIGTSLL